MFESTLCRIHSAVSLINLYASATFLVVLSFDRYLCLVHPVRSRDRYNTLNLSKNRSVMFNPSFTQVALLSHDEKCNDLRDFIEQDWALSQILFSVPFLDINNLYQEYNQSDLKTRLAPTYQPIKSLKKSDYCQFYLYDIRFLADVTVDGNYPDNLSVSFG